MGGVILTRLRGGKLKPTEGALSAGPTQTALLKLIRALPLDAVTVIDGQTGKDVTHVYKRS